MTDRVQAYSRDYDILRYPVLTEKSTMVLEKANAYVFVVDINATKRDVKNAVERIFGVKVDKINTIVNKGKVRGFRGRYGKRADVKKAVVRLNAGDKIELGVGV